MFLLSFNKNCCFSKLSSSSAWKISPSIYNLSWNVPSVFEYLDNQLDGLDVTWQTIRGNFTAHAWTGTHEAISSELPLSEVVYCVDDVFTVNKHNLFKSDICLQDLFKWLRLVLIKGNWCLRIKKIWDSINCLKNIQLFWISQLSIIQCLVQFFFTTKPDGPADFLLFPKGRVVIENEISNHERVNENTTEQSKKINFRDCWKKWKRLWDECVR